MMGMARRRFNFFSGIFSKTPLLETDVETRDGEEDGGARTDEVGEEGGLAFGEEDVHGCEEHVHLDDGALGYVREGKVGEDAVDAFGGVDAEGRLHGLAHERRGSGRFASRPWAGRWCRRCR